MDFDTSPTAGLEEEAPPAPYAPSTAPERILTGAEQYTDQLFDHLDKLGAEQTGTYYGPGGLTTFTPEPNVDAKSLQASFPGVKGLDQPMPLSVAKDVAAAQARKEAQQNVLARWPSGAGAAVEGLGADAISGLLDPVADAAFMVPVVGESRYAAWLVRAGESSGMAGRLGVTAGVGALRGAGGGALLAGGEYASGADPDMTLGDIAYQALTTGLQGAVFHSATSFRGDILGRRFLEAPEGRAAASDAGLDDAATKVVAAQIASGSLVDARPVFDAARFQSALKSGTAPPLEGYGYTGADPEAATRLDNAVSAASGQPTQDDLARAALVHEAKTADLSESEKGAAAEAERQIAALRQVGRLTPEDEAEIAQFEPPRETKVPNEQEKNVQPVSEAATPETAILRSPPRAGEPGIPGEGEAEGGIARVAGEEPGAGRGGTEEGEQPAAVIPAREPIAHREISDDTAVTASGRSVPVKYALAEAGDLVPSQTQEGNPNPLYPKELQPRDRARAVSDAQIADISQNLNPALLDKMPMASHGAPIISPDGTVESGNGRTLAVQRAYSQGSAEAYRAHLAEQGYPVEGMKEPVLVRVRQGEMIPEERQAFAREANQGGTLAMSATERASADAAAMPDHILDLYRGGDIESAANRPFVRAFMDAAVDKTEQGAMVGPDGALSQDAIRRVQGALLAKAYDDANIVSAIIESPDAGIRAIGGALTDAAADWAKMRAAARDGDMPAAMDQTPRLLDAVKIVRHARAEGRNVAEYVGQSDMFTGKSVDPETEAYLRLMFRDTVNWTQPVGREKLGEALRFYADEARIISSEGDLLGETSVTAADILARAKGRQYGRETDLPNLFAAPAPRHVEGLREAGAAGTEPGTGAAEAGRVGEAGADRGQPAADAAAGNAPAGVKEPLPESVKQDRLGVGDYLHAIGAGSESSPFIGPDGGLYITDGDHLGFATKHDLIGRNLPEVETRYGLLRARFGPTAAGGYDLGIDLAKDQRLTDAQIKTVSRLANFRHPEAGAPTDIHLDINDKFVAKGDEARRAIEGLRELVQKPESRPPAGVSRAQAAFHGSPHDFDKFSNEAIGSGEGAQSYGYGHYFAGKKEVAQYYRDTLAGNAYPSPKELEHYFKPGRVISGYGGNERVLEFHPSGSEYGGGWHVLVQGVRKGTDGRWIDVAGDIRDHQTAPSNHQIVQSYEDDGLSVPTKGKLYHVDLAPKDDEWLDYDKPLSEQSQTVKDRLKAAKLWPGRDGNPVTGTEQHAGTWLRAMAQAHGGMPEGSEALRRAGVPGIRYADQGSRLDAARAAAEANEIEQGIPSWEEKIADIRADIERNKDNPHLLPRYFEARNEEIAQVEKHIADQRERLKDAKEAATGATHNYVVFDPEHITILSKAQQAAKAFGKRGVTEPPKGTRPMRFEDGTTLHLPDNPSPAETKIINDVSDIANRIVPDAKVYAARHIGIGEGFRQESGVAESDGAGGITQIDGVRNLIAWSLESNNPAVSMRHEGLHWLRANNYIKPDEWDAIERASRENDWRGQFNIEQRYPNAPEWLKTEESAAEAMGYGKTAPDWVPEAIKPIFEKVQNLLSQVADYMRRLLGANVTAKDVFSRIESGEVGRRIPGQFDQRAAAQAQQTPRTPEDERNAALSRITAMQDAVKRNAIMDYVEHARTNGLGLAHGITAKMRGISESIEGARDSTETDMTSNREKYLGTLITGLEKIPGAQVAWDRRLMTADWTRELFELSKTDGSGRPGVTGNRTALDIAKAVHDAQTLAKFEGNRAGAWRGDYNGYVARTQHNAEAIHEAGYQAWRDFTLAHLDQRKTFGDLSPQEIEDFMTGSWHALSTGIHLTSSGGIPGLGGTGNLANRLSQSRVFHWKDADSWRAYQTRFGQPDIELGVAQSLMRAGRDVALMKRWGSNPQYSFEKIIRDVREKYRDDHDAIAELAKQEPRLREEFKHLTGDASIPKEDLAFKIISAGRAIEDISKLNQVVFAHLSVMATKPYQLRFLGMGRFQAYTAAIRNLVEDKSPQGRALMENLHSNATGRIQSMMHGYEPFADVPGAIARTQAFALRLGGLPWLLSHEKAGTTWETANLFGQNVGKSFGDLNPKMQRILSLHAISPAEWDVLRNAPDHDKDATGLTYLTPKAADRASPQSIDSLALSRIATASGPEDVARIQKDVRDNLAMKLAGLYADTAGRSVVTPGVAERALFTRTAGAYAGPLIGQYKTWAAAAVRQMWGQARYGMGRAEAAKALAGLFAMMTVMGAARSSIGDVLKGETPDMPNADMGHDAALFAKWVVAGGGMGIFGDYIIGTLLHSGQSAKDRALSGVAALAGPVVSDASELLFGIGGGLAEAPFAHDAQARDKELAKQGDAALNFMISHLPVVNTFYIRKLMDWLVLDRLHEMTNPGYMKRYQAAVKARTGQDSFLGPNFYLGAPQQGASQ